MGFGISSSVYFLFLIFLNYSVLFLSLSLGPPSWRLQQAPPISIQTTIEKSFNYKQRSTSIYETSRSKNGSLLSLSPSSSSSLNIHYHNLSATNAKTKYKSSGKSLSRSFQKPSIPATCGAHFSPPGTSHENSGALKSTFSPSQYLHHHFLSFVQIASSGRPVNILEKGVSPLWPDTSFSFVHPKAQFVSPNLPRLVFLFQSCGERTRPI